MLPREKELTQQQEGKRGRSKYGGGGTSKPWVWISDDLTQIQSSSDQRDPGMSKTATEFFYRKVETK